MRSLAVILFFLIVIIGLGAIAISPDFALGEGSDNSQYALGQMGSNRQTTVAQALVVDRENDDRSAGSPCTAAPNDCTLRDAVELVNESEGVTTISFASSFLIRLKEPLPPLETEKTTLLALPGQEVHVDGQNMNSAVLVVSAPFVTIDGLRIYGAGPGFANIMIVGSAHHVTIANNVIGDDDAPQGNCGASNQSYAGIFVDASGEFGDGARAWIHGNIVECNQGAPGDGITIRSDKVVVGTDQFGKQGTQQSNIIRLNRGFGVNLTDATGNTISDNQFISNGSGGLYVSNFHDNNILFNRISDGETDMS